MTLPEPGDACATRKSVSVTIDTCFRLIDNFGVRHDRKRRDVLLENSDKVTIEETQRWEEAWRDFKNNSTSLFLSITDLFAQLHSQTLKFYMIVKHSNLRK